MKPELRGHRPKFIFILLLSLTLLLAACQQTDPAADEDPTDSDLLEQADHTDLAEDADADHETPTTENGATAVDFDERIDQAVSLYRQGEFDEGLAMMEAVVEEMPDVDDATQDLLDTMVLEHPERFNPIPFLEPGISLGQREILDLGEDVAPAMVYLYTAPSDTTQYSAVFLFDTGDLEWWLNGGIDVDSDCRHGGAFTTAMRGVYRELVVYGHCIDDGPAIDLDIKWSDEEGGRTSGFIMSGEAQVQVEERAGADVLVLDFGDELKTIRWDEEEYSFVSE